MSWQAELEQDIFDYDALTSYSINLGHRQRKLFWIWNKWKRRFDERDAFLQTQRQFPKEIAWEIALYIAPTGFLEQYFPRAAWDIELIGLRQVFFDDI